MDSIHKKPLSYEYRNPHYKSEAVWRPYQGCDGVPYTNKAVNKGLDMDCLPVLFVYHFRVAQTFVTRNLAVSSGGV